jgi:diguanylate cyclase (GGDEF)-like protein
MESNNQSNELSLEELRALIPQLQELTERYKRSESIQHSLFNISQLASSISELSKLYPAIHEIIAELMNARNFFVAFNEEEQDMVNFVYFVDEHDEKLISKLPKDQLGNGITGHVLRTGEALFLKTETFKEEAEKRGISLLGADPIDLIAVPLKRGKQVVGAMTVQSYDASERYNEENLEVLLFVSQHIMTTVDRVRSRELIESTIRERTKQLRTINEDLQEEIQERQKVETLQQALFEISELSASVDSKVDSFYSQLHEVIGRLISAPNFYIAILSEDKAGLEFPYYRDEVSKVVKPRALSNGLTEYVINSGRAALIDAEEAFRLKELGDLDDQTPKSMEQSKTVWLGSPLFIDGEVIGVIAIQSYDMQSSYSLKDLELLRFVSHHIAVAMERKRASNAIKKYNEELSSKIKERTEELNVTNEYLKKQIEERKEIELKLIHDAHHDTLTGLPNRAMFTNRLELAVANKKRYQDNNFAVLFIDLDRFKNINDTMGHHAGDLFLIEVSTRISQCIRGHDLLARLGGDEFVILLDSFDMLEDVEDVANRILDSLGKPFVIEDKEMYSGGSIGVAILESYYQSADEIIRDADAAMYQAKSMGRGRFIMFDQGMRDKLLQELELESAFRHTLKSSNFNCYFRPIVDMDSKEWKYLELYIRWQHPELGKVKREQFWQVAEHAGLTIEIDNFMIERACFMLSKLQEAAGEGQDVKIAINLSINHLLQSKLVNQLINTIQATDINAKNLIFEFDENDLNRRSQFMLPAIRKLRRLGVTLVLDNFGSGLASLSYLYSYPFDYVKIDHRFVKSLPRSQRNTKLIQSVIFMSKTLDFKIVAEGIEREEQYDTLMELGCQFGQGPFISEAYKLEDFLDGKSDLKSLTA